MENPVNITSCQVTYNGTVVGHAIVDTATFEIKDIKYNGEGRDILKKMDGMAIGLSSRRKGRIRGGKAEIESIEEITMFDA